MAPGGPLISVVGGFVPAAVVEKNPSRWPRLETVHSVFVALYRRVVDR